MRSKAHPNRFQLLLLLIAIPVLSACLKDPDVNESTRFSSANCIGEVMFNDLHKMAEEVAKGEEQSEQFLSAIPYSFGPCATVSVIPDWPDPTFPKVISVTFDSLCDGIDGRTRSGLLLVRLSDAFRNPGAVMEIMPENLQIDFHSISGTRTVTNLGANANGNLQFEVLTRDGQITTPTNNEIDWNATRIRVWIEGEDTRLADDGRRGLVDDVYTETGTGCVTENDDGNIGIEIIDGLRIDMDCLYITSGTMEVTPPEPNDLRTANFGDGTCEQEVVVSWESDRIIDNNFNQR
ncbi:MAG: hypothetical protein ACFB10_22060 [Salibacteraceae bacterium]